MYRIWPVLAALFLLCGCYVDSAPQAEPAPDTSKLADSQAAGAATQGRTSATTTEPPVCNEAGTLCWPSATPTEISPGARRPRVILTVMLDDADYHDFGYYSTDAVTPAIDDIARSGVVLSRYYTASAICSPTRASLLTGNNPLRYGVTRLWSGAPDNAGEQFHFGMRALPAEDTTVAEALREEGYRTFHVGKWHLGQTDPASLPNAHGFELFKIPARDWQGNVTSVIENGGTRNLPSEYKAQYEASRIMSFIDWGIRTGQDVYINWWPSDPHALKQPDGSLFYVPQTFDRARFDADAPGNSLDLSTDRGKLLSMLYSFDNQLERVTDYMRRRRVFDDSLIVVTSDNGGHHAGLSPTRVLSGDKATMTEGGIRVPFALSWPNRIASNSHSERMMHSADVFPTIMGLIGRGVPPSAGGEDLSAAFLGRPSRDWAKFFSLRRTVFRRFTDERRHDSFALIDGCDKIRLASSRYYFYNLCTDPFEQRELSSERPHRFAELVGLLRARRLLNATYLSQPSVVGHHTLAHSERLDIQHDDLSIYSTIAPGRLPPAGSYRIYQRGQGVDFRVENGMLIARITGPSSRKLRPSMRTVYVRAPMPADDAEHRVALVIRGYLSAASSIRLFIDGQLVDQLQTPIGVRDHPGNSVLSVMAEDVEADLGDPVMPLQDVLIFTNAIEPDEIV